MASFRLIGLHHIDFKLVDFLYDDVYFQRSPANFWDIANPTDFDAYLHSPDCLCHQVSDCPIIDRKHFYFWHPHAGMATGAPRKLCGTRTPYIPQTIRTLSNVTATEL